MTKEEMQKQIMDLQRECNEKQNHIRRLYACEHNPVYPGNIITDHYHTIKVEKISMYGHPVPYMKYTGIELTKQGEPKKRQPIPPKPVFQCDIVSINGKPYKYEAK
jgi:hypothetical protein